MPRKIGAKTKKPISKLQNRTTRTPTPGQEIISITPPVTTQIEVLRALLNKNTKKAATLLSKMLPLGLSSSEDEHVWKEIVAVSRTGEILDSGILYADEFPSWSVEHCVLVEIDPFGELNKYKYQVLEDPRFDRLLTSLLPSLRSVLPIPVKQLTETGNKKEFIDDLLIYNKFRYDPVVRKVADLHRDLMIKAWIHDTSEILDRKIEKIMGFLGKH